MARLLIIANRLPITVTHEEGPMSVRNSPGGLASGLRTLHERSDGLWIGWSGSASRPDGADRRAVERRLAAMRAVPVWLSSDDVAGFYNGFSNGVLWPLFHYLLDQLPLHIRDWDAYERVNQRFADVAATHYERDDLVWVHDYQLMLLPKLLRQRLPHARIGFFLHTPFPASEVFRILPFREQLLEGLLGADLVGFHTAAYLRHFVSSLLRILGIAADLDRVRVDGRDVRLGVFPMGIDTAKVITLAEDRAVAAEACALRSKAPKPVLLGIDRLDYTKGIPRRLLAFEQVLRRHPALRGHAQLIQVAVPSRTDVGAYRGFRRQVETMIGRLNGAFATPGWVPVHYLYRELSERELIALYRAADVMLVTPVRDGMNLVAKEFVAARTDDDGVLVISEFAGAAAELAEALHVNPFDVDRAADVYFQALTMPETERRTRMRALRKRVLSYDVHFWVGSFLQTLAATSTRAAAPAATEPTRLGALVERVRAAGELLLLLDYDGTLVPFATVPELAAPDEALLDLLRALAARRCTSVHLVSGRTRENVERWFGALPIGLHAEHGLWSRDGSGEWTQRQTPPLEWRDRVLPILTRFATDTPGSLVEEKSASIAWHYRMADPEFGPAQANEIRLHLTELLSNAPVEILTGNKVIEVRPYGINKGVVVTSVAAAVPESTLIVAMGDDRTDEDLFAALPSGAVAIHVGSMASAVDVRLAGPAEARRLLASLLTEAPAAASRRPRAGRAATTM